MKVNLLLFSINVLVVIGIALFIQSSAITLTLLLIFFLGILFASTIKDYREEALQIFLLIFIPYIFYGLISYLNFVDTKFFFLYPDQEHFYDVGNSLGNYSSVSEIFKKSFIERIHIETEGAYFTFGFLAYLANFFDGNNILHQSLWVSFTAILINIFVFRILLFYVPSNKAKNFTLFYALFSGLFFFSPWILRDVHIAFLYIIAIYIVHIPFTFKRLLLFIPLAIVTLEFRLEHGLFYLIFPIIYIYLAKESNLVIKKFWGLILLLGFGVITSLGIYFLPRFQYALGSMERYSEFTAEQLNEGLGTQLYKLPMGIKELAISLFSQFHPFPPWSTVLKATNVWEYLIGFINLVTAVSWSILFLFLLLILISNFRNYFKLPLVLNILLLATFLFFLLNTSNIHPRRILAMYPVLLFAFAYFNTFMEKYLVLRYRVFSVISYLGMLALYLFLKFT